MACAFHKPAQRDADQLIIEFIAVNSIPVRVICSEQFEKFPYNLQPNKPPTKSKVRSELENIFDRSKMTTINKLKGEARNTLTIEIDGWSGQNKMHLIALTLSAVPISLLGSTSGYWLSLLLPSYSFSFL